MLMIHRWAKPFTIEAMFLSQSFRYEMKRDCMFSLLCCLHAAVFLFLRSCPTMGGQQAIHLCTVFQPI